MSDEEKNVYEKKANEDKARYAEEMKTYREQVALNPPPQPQPQQTQQHHIQLDPNQQVHRIVQAVPQGIHPHQQVIMLQQPVNGGPPQQIMMVPHNGQMEYTHSQPL